MQRFLFAGALEREGQEVTLPPEAARQATTVLRLRPGDEVALFADGGPEWRAVLSRVERGTVVARLAAPVGSRPRPKRRLCLCQALLKGEKLEWVLQKGTELGVAVFQPLLSERVVARKEGVPERWRRIVIEATEQCGSVRVPEIREPVALADAVRAGSADGPRVLCWEGEETQVSLSEALRAQPADALALFVGPEGGFAEREVAQARAAGVQTVSLGPQILRAETAAIAATALALLAP